MIDCVQVTFEWKKQIPTIEKKVFLIGVCEDMLILHWDEREEIFNCFKYVIPGIYSSLSIIFGESGGIYGLLPISIDSFPGQTITLILCTSAFSNSEYFSLMKIGQIESINKVVSSISTVDQRILKYPVKPNHFNVSESKTQKDHSGEEIGNNNEKVLNLSKDRYDLVSELQNPPSIDFTNQINRLIGSNQCMKDRIIDLESQVVKLNSMFSNSFCQVDHCQTEIAKLHRELEVLIKFKCNHLEINKGLTSVLLPSEIELARLKDELHDTKRKLRLADEKKEIIIHLATKNIRKYKCVYDCFLNGSGNTEKFQNIKKLLMKSTPLIIPEIVETNVQDYFDGPSTHFGLDFDSNMNELELDRGCPNERSKQVATLLHYIEEKRTVELLKQKLYQSQMSTNLNQNRLESLENIQIKSSCELLMIIGVIKEYGLLERNFSINEGEDLFSIIRNIFLSFFNVDDFSGKGDPSEISSGILHSENDLNDIKQPQIVILRNVNSQLRKRNIELKTELDKRTLNAVRYKKERNQALHNYSKLELLKGKTLESQTIAKSDSDELLQS